MGRRLPWLVAVPLLVAGSLSAHELAYRIVAPGHGQREALLDATGHGYLDRLPLVAGVLGALLLCGLAVRVLGARRTSRCEAVARRAFFVLPLVGFALQEHLERLLHDGSFPLAAMAEPTFLVGLALQLPFAVAAYAVAVALLDVAERLVLAVRSRRPSLRAPQRSRLPRACANGPLRIPALALGHAGRAPPLRFR